MSLAEQAGLNLTLSETPKTGFFASRPIYVKSFFTKRLRFLPETSSMFPFCVPAANAQVRLCISAGSAEASLCYYKY